ncbi:MAG: ATP-binding protein [Muribaculaceae bacterium]|nr:ATP-binding protein [Muribaculaceae bacterium]
MAQMVKYPIGQQDFKTLREDNSLYVDKTQFIEKIVSSPNRYYFLARPRRFGKSLFLSSLQYFFEGRRDLFKGLYIDSTDWNWESYPVLRLDLNTEKYEVQGLLDSLLDNTFKKWEKGYDIKEIAETLSTRFQNIIGAAHEKTGRQVVILVDEYDKPLVGNLNVDDNFEHYRAKLASVYSNFKSSAEHIRLVFLTGVSRFSKLSVFSDLNNLNDITFDNDFADICGITEKELIENFQVGIEKFAEENDISYKDACLELKRNYDGYKFAKKGSDIYNPWSVLNCLSKREISNYWGRTGKPTIIAEAMYRFDEDIESLLNTQCDETTLHGFDLKNASPLAMLFQTGYLTIKEYDRETQLFTLGVPNREVSESLFKELLPYYVKVRSGGDSETVVRNIVNSILLGQPEKLVKNIDIFFAGIPYEMKMEDENNLHNAIYILLTLIGVKTETEVHTSDGRIDLVVKTPKFIYIIEFKFDHSAEQAMTQIEQKQYALHYANDSRRLFKIGINFSSKTRHLDVPRIEKANIN